MHTRRLASFFLGAWIVGTILMMFVAQQNFREVSRIIESPPPQLLKEIDELGRDLTQQLLRFQAAESNRALFDIWGIFQVGLAAALVSSATLTAHRSRFLIIVCAAMLLVAAIQTWYIVPALKSLGRAIDFLPAAANSPERESHHAYHAWYGVLDVIKLILAFCASGRLLFDRYGWRDKLVPAPSAPRHRRRRRRKRTSDGSDADIEVETVDDTHDSHVDR